MPKPFVQLVDLQAQYLTIKDEIDSAIKRVVESGSFILGQEVVSFETEFAAYCDAKHCVACANGTDALTLLLQAVGVGASDEVITVSHTFFATIEAIISLGATPVFVDVEESTLLMDVSTLESAITPRTRAIVVVHLYGQMVNMRAVMTVAQRHGLRVVEDAAQAHGARHAGTPPGTLSDGATFSFYPGKNLGAYGDAGAIVTKNDDVASMVRRLRDHGRSDKYEHLIVGRNSRMDAIQAAILRVKLQKLDEWNLRRSALARLYDEALRHLPVRLPTVAAASEAVHHLYVVRVRDRDDVLARMRGDGIGVGVHYPLPVHLQPALRRHPGAHVTLATTELAATRILSLPLYPELASDQLERTVSALERATSRPQSGRT